MPTGNFQVDLTSANFNAVVECLNVNRILEEELKTYKVDYFPVIGEFIIEVCDMATTISSLAPAPIPDINTLEDSKSQQAAKIHNIWSNYPKAGLQMWIDIGTGLWRRQGQAITIQNIPFQLPINVLKPYLSSINNFKLLGTKGRLGAQIVVSEGWTQLGAGDVVTLKGDWRFTVELKERINKPIKNIFPIASNLSENQAQTIRPANDARRLLVLTNDGNNKIYVYFGDTGTVSLLTGIPISPGETIHFLEYKESIVTQISAICPVGEARLIGMEGTI